MRNAVSLSTKFSCSFKSSMKDKLPETEWKLKERYGRGRSNCITLGEKCLCQSQNHSCGAEVDDRTAIQKMLLEIFISFSFKKKKSGMEQNLRMRSKAKECNMSDFSAMNAEGKQREPRWHCELNPRPPLLQRDKARTPNSVTRWIIGFG